jgi:hypothetical protein
MPDDTITTDITLKDGTNHRIIAPKDYFTKDKDGNLSIANQDGLESIIKQETENKSGPGKSPSSRQVFKPQYNPKEEFEKSSINKFPLNITSPSHTAKYSMEGQDQQTPWYDKILGYGEDAVNLAGVAAAPEIAAFAKAKPIITALTSSAGYGMNRLADSLGASEEESEAIGLGASLVGSSLASPKMMGGYKGSLSSIKPTRGLPLAALGYMLGGPKGSAAGEAVSQIPEMIRGFLTGGAGKDWLPKYERPNYPEPDFGVRNPSVSSNTQIPGAYNMPSGNYQEAPAGLLDESSLYKQPKQKLLTAPDSVKPEFHLGSGETEQQPEQQEKPKRVIKKDEEKSRLKGYTKKADQAGKNIRKVLSKDKTLEQRTAEDLVKGLEEGRKYNDEGEEITLKKEDASQQKPKRVVKKPIKKEIQQDDEPATKTNNRTVSRSPKQEQKENTVTTPEKESKSESPGTAKIATEHQVQQHANESGIGIDEAKKQLEDSGHEVYNRAKLNKAIHGLGRSKGLTHDDISDIASSTHKTDSMSKLTEDQLHNLYKTISDLPDKELKSTTKAAGNGNQKTKSDLIKQLEDSLKKIKKTD